MAETTTGGTGGCLCGAVRYRYAGRMRVSHAERKRITKTEDSLAERGEFELPGDFVNRQ